MHKTKKKTKPVKLPKPIKIKKEKTEEDRSLQSMAHYIDDRLELVKQIFGTLKPKTITNLAPDFIKKRPMDEIEEMCLNELLGISTKRLLSIINASKCPTDTESSGDSDVEHKEEHISLEEISSDSELEGASSSAAKKKLSNSKKGVKSATENNQNDGQISVLELLELQARARAIRSQLAHEPVTKIEVDSDEGDANKSSNDRKESRRERKRKSSEQEQQRAARSQKSSVAASTSKPSKSNGSTEVANKETDKPTAKKIKLKRTYRNGNSKNSESSANAEDSKPLTTEPPVARNSRSPSPDVIPIVTDCVTLLISDDSEGEQAVKSLEKAIVLAANNTQEKSKSDRAGEPGKVRKMTETEEEGEIVEKEYEEPLEPVTEEVNKNTEVTNEKEEPKSSCEDNGKEKPALEDKVAESAKPEDSGKPVKSITEDSNSASSVSENKEEAQVTEAVNDTANVKQTSSVVVEHSGEITATTNPIEDDDQNDDVISIGGGDLESEMSDHLTQDTKEASPKADAQRDADVISLESSEDERAKVESSESWHARYLKSSKVSKVLATSRLGKRVRDKIKKSKRSKKDSMREAEAEAAAAKQSQSSSSSFTSKHEDGSVEQYKELLEMRPRKN